ELVETETTAGETALGRAAVCDLGQRTGDRSLFRLFFIGRFCFQPCDCTVGGFYRCPVGTAYWLSFLDPPVLGRNTGVARRVFILVDALASQTVCLPSPRQHRSARAKPS